VPAVEAIANAQVKLDSDQHKLDGDRLWYKDN
jgi:hypothetical protein